MITAPATIPESPEPPRSIFEILREKEAREFMTPEWAAKMAELIKQVKADEHATPRHPKTQE